MRCGGPGSAEALRLGENGEGRGGRRASRYALPRRDVLLAFYARCGTVTLRASQFPQGPQRLKTRRVKLTQPAYTFQFGSIEEATSLVGLRMFELEIPFDSLSRFARLSGN